MGSDEVVLKSFKFYEGQILEMETFIATLVAFGYRRQGKVQEEGDFSRLGGVVDCFPTTFEYPIRIVWDNNAIQSIDSYALATGKPFWKHKIVILLPKKSERRPAISKFGAGLPVPKSGFPLSGFVDIKKGDHVVHRDHGVGVFLGIEKIKSIDGHRDSMVIRYAGEDRLFVPVDQMHLVQKYVNFGGRPPKIHRLGSGEWKRSKLRAKKLRKK
ncbi:MAG TPA: CarD family transcriptional regulator [Candidatus Omnitrophota bacterium]|nr:CarD family transcriptional regulator [Candidatus Omnitrophota bacterium]